MLHSDICGSKRACHSPQLFAAYRVLLRLPMPRHSPCALISLTIFLVLNYARFSFEEFIVVFLPRKLLNELVRFVYVVLILVCFPHCIYLLFSLFNFQDTNSQTFLFVVGTSGLEPPTSRLSGVRSNHLSYAPISWPDWQFLHLHPFGGDEEDRTPDPLRARQVLSQLSYTPIWVPGCH